MICRYAECLYAECLYAECRDAECRGAKPMTTFFKLSKIVKIYLKSAAAVAQG